MRAVAILLVLLVALGLGGWANYERNADLDKELEFRPYAGLSDEDLAALVRAYESNVNELAQSLGSGPDQSSFRRAKPSDLQGKIAAFDRFQAENERWKKGYREALSQKVVIDNLHKEQAIRRAGLHDPWNRIWRRVTTL